MNIWEKLLVGALKCIIKISMAKANLSGLYSWERKDLMNEIDKLLQVEITDEKEPK